MHIYTLTTYNVDDIHGRRDTIMCIYHNSVTPGVWCQHKPWGEKRSNLSNQCYFLRPYLDSTTLASHNVLVLCTSRCWVCVGLSVTHSYYTRLRLILICFVCGSSFEITVLVFDGWHICNREKILVIFVLQHLHHKTHCNTAAPQLPACTSTTTLLVSELSESYPGTRLTTFWNKYLMKPA